MDSSGIKTLLTALGFAAEEGKTGIFTKKYDGYALAVDIAKNKIDYGSQIRCGNEGVAAFSRPENFVVLECIDRLLTKGYKPQHIEIEKYYKAGHGHSGKLDICVERDGKEYLLIECKTYGAEFDKALAKMSKDGGQLFTYFIFRREADLLMLYSSRLKGKSIEYKNAIVNIEPEYRQGGVDEFYDRWNKLTDDNGIFEPWAAPYHFRTKALKHDDLRAITNEDSKFIFIRFLEILRHNVVSDKPNAFNKIFTLFLCKIYDEKMREGTKESLHFQWMSGEDHRTFQLRLTDLYKSGMRDFLDKEVSDFSKDDFNKEFQHIDSAARQKLVDIIDQIRLEKNNEFAIKEVFDVRSFEENAVVVKAIVELLQKFRVRYAERQQYLSDFFELLLTTGLKQEAGQFFTPVPIAQFILRCLPIVQVTFEKLASGKKDDMLPYIIDYAAGSGHFLTESMHIIQELIHKADAQNKSGGNKLNADAQQKISGWIENPFDWAFQYIYGVEKDYRLVKVGKVGCYLHGDGLANVIHSDGLAAFDHVDYKNKLQHRDKKFPLENKQFDIVVSNPPYSVSTFKNAAKNYYGEKDFELYSALTDNSSEIECLFVERTKQLLKDGGYAGIILPSSILSSGGIYAKTREMILRYFEIIAVTELGSNTFMATGTKTVILFLRRRNNYDVRHWEERVGQFFHDYQDAAIAGIDAPITNYVQHVWSGLQLADYVSLLQQKPTKAVQEHPLYQEYRRKIQKDEKDFWKEIYDVERKKIFFFVLAYPQPVMIVKSGMKNAEKRFLGYEFSNRRGNEGIHPVQRGKSVDECTKMFDVDVHTVDNPEKASSYILKAFLQERNPLVKAEPIEVHPSLKDHIFQMDLADMMTFDRAEFDTRVSLVIKKKEITINSKWGLCPLEIIATAIETGSRPVGGVAFIKSGAYSLGGEHIHHTDGCLDLASPKFVPQDFFDNAAQGKLQKYDLLICKDGALTGKVALVRNELDHVDAMINEHIFLVRCNNTVTQKYLFNYLFGVEGQELLKSKITGAAQGGLNSTELKNIMIPLPPLDVQKKIVREIEKIEADEAKTKEKIAALQERLHLLGDDIAEQKGSSEKLEYLVDIQSGLWTGKKPPFQMAKVLRNTNFKLNNGKLSYDDIAEIQVEERQLAERMLQYGDIILEKSGGSETQAIGRVVLFDKKDDAVYSFSNFCARIRVKDSDKVHPVFLWFFLHRFYERGGTQSLQHGVRLLNIDMPGYRAIDVPLPPLSEQERIVAEIEQAESEIAALQSQLQSIAEQKRSALGKYL